MVRSTKDRAVTRHMYTPTAPDEPGQKAAATGAGPSPAQASSTTVNSCAGACWYVTQWFLAGLVVAAFGAIFVFAYLHPPQPALTAHADSLSFEAAGGVLRCNGSSFSIKGVNWFGSEAYNGPPNGLHKHGIHWYLDFLQLNKFNAIRILFNHEHVLKDEIIDAPTEESLLKQVRYIEMFRILATEAAKRGIILMLACHRMRPDAWPGAGLWYDESIGFSETRVKQSWSRLASALCGQWNIFAVDLQNEPHASSWGKNMPTDWNHGAERIGNHVLSACPRWLIMVEGVGYTPGAPGGDDPGAGFWWGENLVGARVAPVQLQDQSKLVYSPHVYGPSVYMQKYFQDGNFPENMPSVWDQHFAFAQPLTGQPIVIGELGGTYVDEDKVWQDWAIPYMVERGFSLFYFALQPDSKDTGGLLTKDWSLPGPGSPEVGKLMALSALPSTDVLSMCPACQAAVDEEATRSAQKPVENLVTIPGVNIAVAQTDLLALLALALTPLAMLFIGLICLLNKRSRGHLQRCNLAYPSSTISLGASADVGRAHNCSQIDASSRRSSVNSCGEQVAEGESSSCDEEIVEFRPSRLTGDASTTQAHRKNSCAACARSEPQEDGSSSEIETEAVSFKRVRGQPQAAAPLPPTCPKATPLLVCGDGPPAMQTLAPSYRVPELLLGGNGPSMEQTKTRVEPAFGGHAVRAAGGCSRL